MGIMGSREGHIAPPKERPELGDLAMDHVSQWVGTVTAEYLYLNGCRRLELSGKDDKGAPESWVFDEQQVEVVEKGFFQKQVREQPRRSAAMPSVGGPRDNTPVPR